MTDEDRKRISEYMGWQPYPPACVGDVLFYVDTTYRPIRWDLNAAALCIQEMQKRGDDYVKFIAFAYDVAFDYGYAQYHTVTAWLFNADNFFSAMSQWLKEGDEKMNWLTMNG